MATGQIDKLVEKLFTIKICPSTPVRRSKKFIALNGAGFVVTLTVVYLVFNEGYAAHSRR
jgi:hypothetical protein